MELLAAAKKKIQLLWGCDQLLSGFLAKGHLPRVSRQSIMIRAIPGAVHRSPDIRLTAEENPGNPDEGVVRPVIASNAISYLQM